MSYQDSDDEGANGINRQRIDPDEARTHFLPAQVDARNVDFSDRVDERRKSYRSSSRRKRKGGAAEQALGDFSDEDDDEGLQRKLARLRREIEELRIEAEKKHSNDTAGTDDSSPTTDDVIDEEELKRLSYVLEGVDERETRDGRSSQKRLLTRLIASTRAPKSSTNGSSIPPGSSSQDESTYTISYAPEYQANHTLAKAAEFDTRLTLLESALGIDSLPLPTEERSSAKAILPTLEKLDMQISTISSSSGSSLESMGKRIRQLTHDAEKLDEARKSAKASLEALRASQGEASPPGAINDQNTSIEDPEQTSKINALYGTLSTIETLAPLLPSVLDRLRSLHLMHVDAANASRNLANVEKRQSEMAEDIRSWREGLEKVEAVMKQGELRITENTKEVEVWVKELEERLEKLTSR